MAIEAVAMNFWDKNYHPKFGLIVDAEEWRLLLRPRRAGRVEHSSFYYGLGSPLREYRIGDYYFTTRAQAAQAIYTKRTQCTRFRPKRIPR